MTNEEAIKVLEMVECHGSLTQKAKEIAISALFKNKGKWKKTYLDHVAMGERPSILFCSVCHQCIAYPTNYCPNCGADMRGGTE